MKTVLNIRNYDLKAQPLFLGKTMGIQRFDQIKYEVFKTLYEKQQEFMWRPNEINLVNDRVQYGQLSETERFIFDSNLRFQTMGDSMLSRSIDTLARYVSNTELEYCMKVWSMMECVHSESYTWILNNVVKNPEEFFDSILEDKQIVGRAKKIKESFDNLLGNPNDIKESIFRAILELQIAEGLLFYSSFATSFHFGSRGVMRGNADVIKLIARDESAHLSITQNILKIWKSNKDEGFYKIVTDNEEMIYETYRLAVAHEREWLEYLFSKGTLIGLNAEILHQYVMWLANLRLHNLGMKKLFNQKTNPIGGWLAEYADSSKTASMPQEHEITSYKKGAQNTNVDWEELREIEL